MKKWFLLFIGFFMGISHSQAQVCGIVDDITYPIESVQTVTIANGYDDFARYRNRFGGNHVGLDVGFRQQGEPIQAVARGRVTYADIEGWDTERGVVIIEHTFPDDSRFYTVYGHMEETDVIRFPQVGDCLEMGDVIGVVGAPASSAPHLHYEVRDFLPDDGGPGYTDGNPLSEGWYHPLDFTQLWQLRLNPAFMESTSFDLVPTIPPVYLTNNTVAIASEQTIAVFAAPGGVARWRLTMDDVVTGLVALPGDRVVARSRSGLTVVVAGGRYQAVWQVDGPQEPFVALGETLVFLTDSGDLTAYNPAGEPLWTVDMMLNGFERVEHFIANDLTISVGLRSGGESIWWVVDAAGQVIHEGRHATSPLVAFAQDHDWVGLVDGQLIIIHEEAAAQIGTVGVTPRRTSQIAMDIIGNTYAYLGDPENTLLSWDTGGGLRWRTTYPITNTLLPPLLQVDSGCLLYGLDAGGRLTVFNTADGSLITQTGLYAGGDGSGRPASRLLNVTADNLLKLSAGFLSLATVDGNILGEQAVQNCLLG